MLTTILGSKKGMVQAFVKGRRVPATSIKAGPCVVTYLKTMDKDGYWALQLGFGTRKSKNTSKALQGHLKPIISQKQTPRYLAEVRFNEEPKDKAGKAYQVGDQIRISDLFSLGDIVSVRGVSKGKGFAGGVKRWHFAGGSRTHGQSDRERAPGSIGQGTTPGRVYRGKHMAGRMGGETKTIFNLQIISLDSDKDELQLSGPVPGVKNGLLVIHKIKAGKLEGITEVQPQVVIEEVSEEKETVGQKLEEEKTNA